MRGRIMPCIAAALCIAVTTPAFAGDRPNSLRDGAWAVQFGVGNDFRLTSFEGSSVAIKRYVSDRSALRAIVDMGFRSSDLDGGYEPGFRREHESDDASARLTVLFQRYINPDDDVVFYWGVGPSAGWDWEDEVYRRVEILTGETSSSEREQREFSIGLAAAFGGEFFVRERISLHAEYTADASYVDSKNTQTNTAVDGHKTGRGEDGSRWQGSVGYVRFGLSAYF